MHEQLLRELDKLGPKRSILKCLGSAQLPPSVVVTQEQAMSRFNKARVAMKHHGAVISTLDLEGHRATVVNFFKDNTQHCSV